MDNKKEVLSKEEIIEMINNKTAKRKFLDIYESAHLIEYFRSCNNWEKNPSNIILDDDIMVCIIKNLEGLIKNHSSILVTPDITYRDLNNVASIAIYKQIYKYEPYYEQSGKSATLSTYLTLWIKSALTREVQKTKSILRPPAHLADKSKRVFEARDYLEAKNIPATIDNIYLQIQNTNKYVVETTKSEIGRILNQPTVVNTEGVTIEYLTDSGTRTQEEEAEYKEKTDNLYSFIKQITPIEQIVLVLLRGLDLFYIEEYFEDIEVLEKKDYNKTEIAKLISISKEESKKWKEKEFILSVKDINKFEASAINKLKNLYKAQNEKIKRQRGI